MSQPQRTRVPTLFLIKHHPHLCPHHHASIAPKAWSANPWGVLLRHCFLSHFGDICTDNTKAAVSKASCLTWIKAVIPNRTTGHWVPPHHVLIKRKQFHLVWWGRKNCSFWPLNACSFKFLRDQIGSMHKPFLKYMEVGCLSPGKHLNEWVVSRIGCFFHGISFLLEGTNDRQMVVLQNYVSGRHLLEPEWRDHGMSRRVSVSLCCQR